MKQTLILLVMVFFTSFCFSQTEVSGVIKTKDGTPLASVSVSVTDKQTGKTNGTMTNAEGKFKINAKRGDVIKIQNVGYVASEILLTDDHIKNGLFITLDESSMEEVLVIAAGGAISPKSYWIGAKVGYNFDGFSEDDPDNYFIGAAKVILNESKKEFLKGKWGVVGNIAGFISKQNKEDSKKDLEKVALSVQGLGVGLFQLWEQEVGSSNAIRQYITTGYRLNTFKKVGKDSITVNLSQFKLTGGFEFEAVSFKKGGTMNFAIEVTHLRFDENRYNLIFEEKRKSLTSIELGAILPINSNLGFFASSTFAKYMKPVYLFGIIVRADTEK